MPAHYPVPIQEDIRDLLVDLLGRPVVIDKVEGRDLTEDPPALIAEFSTDDGEPGVLCAMDAPFTLRCGAALAMVPLPVVEEALRRDELPESLVENVREVANILARLLNSPSTPHLRLHALHQLPTELTPAVEALLGSPEFRRDFALTIEGYGNGRLSLLAA
ncbi:MAG TPA: hypothetical protein VIR58_03210 [Acidimicrobiales bacterium]